MFERGVQTPNCVLPKFPPEDGTKRTTACPSKSHLKSTTTACKCQELRWTKQTTMACGSVTAKLPQFARPTKQESLITRLLAHRHRVPNLKCSCNGTALAPCEHHVRTRRASSHNCVTKVPPRCTWRRRRGTEKSPNSSSVQAQGGSRSQSVETSERGSDVMRSLGVREFSRVERGSQRQSVHETVCWMHLHGGTRPDISRTVPTVVALGPGARC